MGSPLYGSLKCNDLLGEEIEAFEIKVAQEVMNALSREDIISHLEETRRTLTVRIRTLNGGSESYRPKMISPSTLQGMIKPSNTLRKLQRKLSTSFSNQYVHRGVLFEGQSLTTEDLLKTMAVRTKKIDATKGEMRRSKSRDYGNLDNISQQIKSAVEMYNQSLVEPVRFFTLANDHFVDNETFVSPYTSTSYSFGVSTQFARGSHNNGRYRHGTRVVTSMRLPNQGVVFSDAVALVGARLGFRRHSSNSQNVDVLNEKEILLAGGIDPESKTRIVAEDTQSRRIWIIERLKENPFRFRVLLQKHQSTRAGHFDVTEEFYEQSLDGEEPVFRKMNSAPSQAWKTIEKMEAQDENLTALFDAHSGVSEGFSVRLHTLMVLNRFYEETRLRENDTSPLGRTIRERKSLLADVLALHDLDKYRPGNRRASTTEVQHDRAVSVMNRILRSLNYSEQELKIAEALIRSQVIGHVIRYDDRANVATEERMTPRRGAQEIRETARSLGIPIAEYFALQTLYFSSDAGSYPSLEASLFTRTGGLSELASPSYRTLRDLIASTP